MKPDQALRIAALALVSGLGLAALTAIPAPAAGCGSSLRATPYSMEVLVDGRPLPEYAASGTAYVEALKGREYAIRLTNRTGERVAVALAVDGLNSIDAKHTSARDARKWILAPWETVTLSGWQTGSDTARRFVFTSESKSYGAWLHRTDDLGVISAAFFREARRPDRIVSAPAPAPAAPQYESGVLGGVEGGVAGGVVGGVANDAASEAPRASLRGETKKSAKDELAATGIGREVEHRVMQVDFDEAAAPTSTLSVRYEYRDALVRLGVIPACDDALARRERARGFSDPEFAPDPYRR